MLSSDFEAKIGNVKVITKKDKDGGIDRSCELTLHYDFDGPFATAIGGNAPDIQKALADSSLIGTPTIPMDADGLHVSVGEEGVEADLVIKDAHGAKVKGKPANKEDSSPRAEVTVEFPLRDEELLYFAHRTELTLTVRMDREQLELVAAEG